MNGSLSLALVGSGSDSGIDIMHKDTYYERVPAWRILPYVCCIPRTRTAFATAGVSLLWIGLLLGVSFLATPVKFMAPSLSLSVALDVGRHTFMVFSWVELALAATLTFLASRSQDRAVLIAAAAALLLVLLQFFWLLPTLDARVEIILQGDTPPASRLHMLYIGVDTLKLLLIGFVAGRIYFMATPD